MTAALVRNVRSRELAPHLSHESPAAEPPAAAPVRAAEARPLVRNARPLVRNVRSRALAPHFSHESWAGALVHEAAMVGVMVAVMAAAAAVGHGAAPMLGAAFVLALVSFGYAPLARTRAWAREHVADLWAMLLVMGVQAVGAEASGAGMGGAGMAGMGGHSLTGHGIATTPTLTASALATLPATAAPTLPATAALTNSAIAAVLLAWLLARVLLARRVWRIHSAVSLAGCGACLLWMLLS